LGFELSTSYEVDVSFQCNVTGRWLSYHRHHTNNVLVDQPVCSSQGLKNEVEAISISGKQFAAYPGKGCLVFADRMGTRTARVKECGCG